MFKTARLLDVLFVRNITIRSYVQERGENKNFIKLMMKKKILVMNKMIKTFMKKRTCLIQTFNFILAMTVVDMMMEMTTKMTFKMVKIKIKLEMYQEMTQLIARCL